MYGAGALSPVEPGSTFPAPSPDPAFTLFEPSTSTPFSTLQVDDIFEAGMALFGYVEAGVFESGDVQYNGIVATDEAGRYVAFLGVDLTTSVSVVSLSTVSYDVT